MAHRHAVLLYHLVFSTEQRAPTLTPEVRPILFPYMNGILRKNEADGLIINGVADHVHLLCRLKPTHAVSEIVKNLKGSSSSWFNKTAGLGSLHWQEGYGAFSVSFSQKDRVYRYIANQKEHHRKVTFAEEYAEFLRQYEIDYDPRYHLD